MNDDGREVKRQKLADDDSAISIGDLTKSEITEVVTRCSLSFSVFCLIHCATYVFLHSTGCVNINHLTLVGWNS